MGRDVRDNNELGAVPRNTRGWACRQRKVCWEVGILVTVPELGETWCESAARKLAELFHLCLWLLQLELAGWVIPHANGVWEWWAEEPALGAAVGFCLCTLARSGSFCPRTQQEKRLAQAGGEFGAVAGWEPCVSVPALGLKELGTITHPVAEGFMPLQGGAVVAVYCPCNSWTHSCFLRLLLPLPLTPDIFVAFLWSFISLVLGGGSVWPLPCK